MSLILVCPYCSAKIEMKGKASATSWIECECGGVFSPEEGIPESEKKRIVSEKEREEHALRVRLQWEKEKGKRQQRIDQSAEWLGKNDTSAIFYERLNKLIEQNEELIELNKAQIALLNRIAMKPVSSSYTYQAPVATTPSTPTYGPNEYLRDKKIYEMEGKHSVAGYAAYQRARDYELGL